MQKQFEGNGGDGVGREEAELNQQRLRVVQREDFLQVGHQDVVHVSKHLECICSE